MNVSVNPYYRFDGLLYDFYENETENEKNLKEKINNLIFHLLAKIDLLEGNNAYQIKLKQIIKEAESGYFGENVKRNFIYLTENKKNIVAKYIKNIMRWMIV